MSYPLKTRSLPDRLRYLADQLRKGRDPEAVAVVLVATAEELAKILGREEA